jgi:hypothetical protein
VGSGHGPYCNRDINTGAVDREGEKKFTRIIISQFLFFCSLSASFFLSDSGHRTSSSLTDMEGQDLYGFEIKIFDLSFWTIPRPSLNK